MWTLKLYASTGLLVFCAACLPFWFTFQMLRQYISAHFAICYAIETSWSRTFCDVRLYNYGWILQALADFNARIREYEKVYVPLTDGHSNRHIHFIQLVNMVTGRGYMDINRISGYIPGKIVFFLMQVVHFVRVCLDANLCKNIFAKRPRIRYSVRVVKKLYGKGYAYFLANMSMAFTRRIVKELCL
jgi:hypothetical protein